MLFCSHNFGQGLIFEFKNKIQLENQFRKSLREFIFTIANFQMFTMVCRGNLCGQKQGSKTKKWISFEIKGNNMTLLEREDHLKQDAYSRLSKKITFQIKTYIQIIVHCD